MYGYIIPLSPDRSIKRSDGLFLPIDINNRHCQQFLQEWAAGATVTSFGGDAVPFSDDAVAALGVSTSGPD